MKRFQKKKITSDDHEPDSTAFLLVDGDDYLSEIKEEPQQGCASVEKKAVTSVSDVLQEYQESHHSSGSNKRRKIDELMTVTREIGLQKPLIEAGHDSSVSSCLGKKNIGLKLLQKFGYGQPAADTLDEGIQIDVTPLPNVVLKGLGKNGKGIIEPLSFQDSLLPGRNTTGLGMQKHLERKELTKLKHLSSLKSCFQQQRINHSLYKKKRKDYYAILYIIYELDCRNDYTFTLPETKEMHSDIEKKMFSLTDAATSEINEREDGSAIFDKKRRYYDDEKTQVTAVNDIDEAADGDVVIEKDEKEKNDGYSLYRIPSIRDLNGNEEAMR
jgi:hypothetical protein